VFCHFDGLPFTSNVQLPFVGVTGLEPVTPTMSR
jgi:hypothetical protein